MGMKAFQKDNSCTKEDNKGEDKRGNKDQGDNDDKSVRHLTGLAGLATLVVLAVLAVLTALAPGRPLLPPPWEVGEVEWGFLLILPSLRSPPSNNATNKRPLSPHKKSYLCISSAAI